MKGSLNCIIRPCMSLFKTSMAYQFIQSMFTVFSNSQKSFMYKYVLNNLCLQPYIRKGAGCSSVDSVPASEAVGRRIDPSQWTQLQFGLFSVPTSGPQLICLWKSAYKRSLAAYRKE